MTVSSSTSTASYVGSDQSVLPLTFRFFDDGEIRFYRVDPLTGVSTLQVLGIDYTLTGAGEPEVNGNAPGTIILTSPLATGTNGIAERVLDAVQNTDLVNQGRFFPEVHEDSFDYLTMLIQQVIASSDGAIRVSIGEPEVPRLPPAQQRADMLLSFDGSGNPVAIVAANQSATDLELRLANNTDPAKGAGMVGAILDGGEPSTVARQLGAYVNVLASGAGNDATAEIQSYVNGQNTRLKRAVFRVTAPIVLQQGARLNGGGWRVDNNNLSTLLNGNSSTILVDHDGPIFTWDGDKDTGNFADNFQFEGFAIYAPTLGANTRGFDLDAFRSSSFSNLYLYNLVAGIRGRGQSWQNLFSRVWMNTCTRGFDSDAGIEDSTFISCVARFGDIGMRQNFSGQTNNLIGCDLSRNRLGLLLNSGGTFNGHVNVQGCQFEMADGADAAIRVESVSTLLPSLTVSGSRFLGLETTPTAPCIFLNNGTDLVTVRNTARNVKDFISVATGAKATTKITRISDELSLVGGNSVAGDDGTFVTTISDSRITLPTGSNKGVRVGSDVLVRQQDGGSKEIVLGDATIGRATDGELSIISASGKAVRLKPGNTQTVVASAAKTAISNQIGATGLPTSTAGLVSGDLWVDGAAGNVVKRVP